MSDLSWFQRLRGAAKVAKVANDDILCSPKKCEISRISKISNYVDAKNSNFAAPDPWAWLPEDCPDDADWNAWDCARILRDVCRREDFSLCRRDSGFILVLLKPMTPEASEVLCECVDYLLDEALPYLVGHADHFPPLTLAAANKCLSMLMNHHGQEGFNVRGWYGLEFPDSWPAAARVAVQSIYIERLILEDGHEGPIH